MEFGPGGQLHRIMGQLLQRRFVGRITGIERPRLAAVPSGLPLGHIEQHLPDFVGRQSKKILDGGRRRLIERQKESDPGFVDDAVEIVSGLQAGKRLAEHFGHQSSQAMDCPFEQLAPRRRVAVLKAIDQRLQLGAAVICHEFRPWRSWSQPW